MRYQTGEVWESVWNRSQVPRLDGATDGRPPVASVDELDELKGLNLACYCALDADCHADVLLEYANGHSA